MTPDQLELAITHYLDGTLPSEDVGALEQTLASDSQARSLLELHEKLTAVLRSQPLPDLDLPEVARDFAAVVTGTVDEQSRASDQKLNAILKMAGPVPAVRWDALAGHISSSLDEELAAADEQDMKLDALLHSDPLPALNWDRLAGEISKAVAAEMGQEVEENPAVILRIGWVQKASRWAVAACLIGAAAVGIRMYTHQSPVAPSPMGTGQAIAEVVIPTAEGSNQPAVAEVSIGPSKTYAEVEDQELYRRNVASRAPVVIAVPLGNEDDSDHAMDFE